MPVYDYRCTSCDEVFQVEGPLGYLDEEVCPTCGGASKRIFQVFEKQPEIGGGACSTHEDIDGIVANMETLLNVHN